MHRLTQLRSMSAKPLTCFAIPGTRRRHQAPICGRVIEPLEVHQLMNHHVVPHPFGHGDESPIEADVTVPPAGSPSCALISNADPRDAQAVFVGELVQPCRQLQFCLGAQSLTIVDGKAIARQPRALTLNPFKVASCEGIGFSPRAPARNGHAHTTIEFDSEQISARPTMAHEIDGGNRLGGCRCDRGVDAARKREPQLHDDRIPDSVTGLDRPRLPSVIFIALVRGT